MPRSRARLAVVGRPEHTEQQVGRLIWTLGLGSFGLAWSVTTVAAYVPPVLEKFTSSTTLIGLVIAAEGGFAILVPLLIGPMSDATQTEIGRRRPFMLLALLPMGVTLSIVAFTSSLPSAALALFGFYFAYYIYEPPYRGLYPDLLPESVFGRAQGAQHVMRGAALGGALVGGGFLLAFFEPFPFVLAAFVTVLTCGAVVVLVREPPEIGRHYERLRTFFAAPWRIVRQDPNVRRFLVANAAWETTFAGMRTFVVLYIIIGLGQPLRVSSTVLAVVAGGYITAALLSGRLADQIGIGRLILGASTVYGFGLLAAGFAQGWSTWFYALIFPVAIAGGVVMTQSWALLFKVMPPTDHGAVTGLAIVTKGFGLLVGPLAVGAAVDIFQPFLEATRGYAAVWPVCAIPILAAIPLVNVLADAEARGRKAGQEA